MLDQRLSTAAALYEPCEVAADVGTDHALLPCHLLEAGVCRRMILADVSPKALDHARAQVARRGLDGRATLVCADGLDAVREKCGCISVMGMGGETIAGILRRGRDRLQGAVLILSAHTELQLVRQAVMEIGYHVTREELCSAGGYTYVVWRAEPGAMALTAEDVAYGPILRHGRSEAHRQYFAWRMRVLTDKLRGMRAAREPDHAAIAAIEQDVACYRAMLEDTTC